MNKKSLITKILFGFSLVGVALSLCAVGGKSFGWFTNYKFNDVSIDSEININYFNGGNGTAPGPGQTYEGGEPTGPYQIHNSKQLYHFAWLQEMGYFNRIGTDGKIETNYFVLTDDIDMTGMYLPTIGTQDYQFVGNFDGRGYTVSNLNITNDKDKYSDDPTYGREEILHYGGVEIVGFFGVVGSLDGDGANTANANINGVVTPNYTYETSANEISNFYIKNCTIETQTDNTLVGLAAGYVNGRVNNVGVIGSNIYLKSKGALSPSLTRNYSDYSLVGYCTPSYRATIDATNKTIVDPVVTQEEIVIDDPGQAAGASIDMRKMYNRLLDIKGHSSRTLSDFNFNISEKYLYEDNGRKVLIDTETDTMDKWRPTYTSSMSLRLYESMDEGTFNFYNDSDTYLYLYGANDSNNYSKTIEEAEYDEENIPGYIIGCGNYVMNIADDHKTIFSKVVETVEDVESCTVFANDNSNHLYADYYGVPYFLNVVGGSLSISKTASTVWNIQEGEEIVPGTKSATFSTVVNGVTRYIAFDGTDFVLFTPGSYITFNGNYLSLGTNNNLTNVAGKTNASIWTFRYSNGQYYIYCSTGTQDVYLRINNGNLTTTTSSTNATLWNLETGDGKTVIHSGTNYIYYDGAWKVGELSIQDIDWGALPFHLTDGNGHYLSVNTSGSSPSLTNTNEANACKWYIENKYLDTDTNIYTVINGTTYYLYNKVTYIFIIPNRNLAVTTTAPSGSKEYNFKISATNTGYSITGSETNGKEIVYSNSSWSYTSGTGTSFVFPKATYYRDLGGKVDLTVETTLAKWDTFYHGTRVIDAETSRVTGYTTSFPLTTEESYPYNVKSVNTGYVTSGGFSTSTASSGQGDIRVSEYGTSDISNSYRNGKLTNIRTISTATGSLSDHVIGDSDKFYKLDDDPQTKAKGSKTLLEETLGAGGGDVYGLHFMDASINMEHLIHQDKAVVLNKTYYNYELPMDSIDFNLSTRGFINFFAGTYYHNGSSDENDSFFSLHQIFRDEFQTITNIKEISTVYGVKDATGTIDDKYEYIYKYSDNTYSKPIPEGEGYEILFDTNWIKYQSSIKSNDNYVYYFEVPANRGEYALGSVSEHNGAYLMYLDLSCSKLVTNRTTTSSAEKVATNTFEYAPGVEFLTSEDEEFELTNQTFNAEYAISGDHANGSISFDKDISIDPETGQPLVTIPATPTDNLSAVLQGDYVQLQEGIPLVTKKTEYLDTYYIEKYDNVISVGAKVRGNVEYTDHIIYIDGEFVSFYRSIVTTVYFYPDGTDSSETKLLEFAFTDYQSQLLYNFDYLFNMNENRFNFTVYMNQACNAEILYVDNNYSIFMNDASINGGVPSSRHIDASTGFTPLVAKRGDIPVD